MIEKFSKLRFIFLIFIFLRLIFAGENQQIYFEVPETALKFKIKKTDYTQFTGIATKGKVISSLTWRDKLGTNLLILTQTGKFPSQDTCMVKDNCFDAELFVYHYKIQNNNALLVRRVYDFVKNCPWDIYVGFLDHSLTITDLDNNECAEIIINYKLSCRSDVTPSKMKLIMLENNTKYALRGKMINAWVNHLSPGKQKKEIEKNGWGQFSIDKAYHNAPKEFLEFSIKRWNDLKDKDEFVQMN